MLAVSATLALLSMNQAPAYAWQEPQAEVLATGDLRYKPVPFEYSPTETVRYIDFDSGSDTAPGTRDAPWKHHPLDANATGVSAAWEAPATYVFKGGVTYRGSLRGSLPGQNKLTQDPTWGDGPATLSGAERITGWSRGADPRMPQPDAIQKVELDFAPRAVWLTETDRPMRLKLARTPNWSPTFDDVRAEWFEWQQPEWWTRDYKIDWEGGRAWLGTDPDDLSGLPDMTGALVWSEWGIVMGSPFASLVEAHDTEAGTIVFQGPWRGDGEELITHNRYYLEDHPALLDEPGEFWFDRQGQGGTLYVWFPEGQDPPNVQVEAARHHALVDLEDWGDLEISGLDFERTNPWWNLEARPFENRETEGAAIRLEGSGRSAKVANNRFAFGTSGVRVHARDDDDRIGHVIVSDNRFHDLDRRAIWISDSTRWAKEEPPFSIVERADVLRNHVRDCGFRPLRADHGHTIVVLYAQAQHIAGNFIENVGGSGLFLFGGKGSGQLRDVPFARSLVHHNRIERALQFTNDWGNLETWQGGPHYVWNNVSLNPGGFWNWSYATRDPEDPSQFDHGSARQGFAYYLDGSFKNYLFNNVAWGKSNELGSPLANTSAFQEIIGFQNLFLNNTAFRFAAGSRRQASRAGRNQWLGNLFEDMSAWLWINADPAEGGGEGNAAHVPDQGDDYSYDTLAYGSNFFHSLPRDFGVFESTGRVYDGPNGFGEALTRRGALRSDVGEVSATSMLRDPRGLDMRLRPGSAPIDGGVRAFVPWALYDVVGEWSFLQNQRDPTHIVDEHWNMAPYYVQRQDYWRTPRTNLTAVGVEASDYVPGLLEDWTNGALRLDGGDHLLYARDADLSAPFGYQVAGETRTASGLEIKNPQVGTSNLLIEVVFESADRDGWIVSKMDGTGYRLGLDAGRIVFEAQDGTHALRAIGPSVADGAWTHVIAELDRVTGPSIYVDGRPVRIEIVGETPTGSLQNPGDLIVGANLAATLDYLRIARGTLANARTTIEELYAWQFDGPFLRDFAGRAPAGKRDAGALEFVSP